MLHQMPIAAGTVHRAELLAAFSYALDITDTANPTFLWEFSHQHLGLSFGNPIVTKLKDGTWAVAEGSTAGYRVDEVLNGADVAVAARPSGSAAPSRWPTAPSPRPR